jgi:transcriptional regulator with XRE-family HTH domain
MWQLGLVGLPAATIAHYHCLVNSTSEYCLALYCSAIPLLVEWWVKRFTGGLKLESFEDFGDLLRQLREEAGLSQNALARAAGMSPSNVNRIEASKQGVPRKTTIMKLVRALGLSLTDERAQQLFAAADRMAKPKPMPSTALHTPFNRRPKDKSDLQPKVRELKRIYLRGLELIADIEEIMTEDVEDDA